jgi:hypothetical protein
MSAYGDLTVQHISPDGKVTDVGLARGLAVYTPNPKRAFELDLERNNKVDYKKGKLHIVYATQVDDKSVKAVDNKPVVMAEADYTIK